jgi:dihydroneopterin aldolase
MIESTIAISGIRASGRHGASAGERDDPQEFVVDLQVAVAAADDELEATADYRALAAAARSVVEGASFVLLETLADAVASAVVRSSGQVRRVTAIVHKPRAARAVEADDVSATGTATP